MGQFYYITKVFYPNSCEITKKTLEPKSILLEIALANMIFVNLNGLEHFHLLVIKFQHHFFGFIEPRAENERNLARNSLGSLENLGAQTPLLKPLLSLSYWYGDQV